MTEEQSAALAELLQAVRTLQNHAHPKNWDRLQEVLDTRYPEEKK